MVCNGRGYLGMDELDPQRRPCPDCYGTGREYELYQDEHGVWHRRVLFLVRPARRKVDQQLTKGRALYLTWCVLHWDWQCLR